MFLHDGIFHIAINMWTLWNLGTLCESLYGRWTYATIYLITGIAGGLGTIAWNPHAFSVGASGALFGLSGALISSFYLGEFSLSGISIKGTLSSLLFFCAFSLYIGSVSPRIDNACHVGGLVSGLIVGALIARVAPEQDRPLRRVGVLLFMVLIVGASAVGIQRWRGSQMGLQQLADREKSIDRMIDELQKRTQQNPQDASAHYALAHEYFVKRQFSDGETELKRVLELQPQNADARMELGAAYLSRDRFKEAEEEFTKLLAQNPNNLDAHVGMGMAFADEQNHAAAINEYKAALRIEPNVRGVNYRLGISQAKLKQYDAAVTSYLKEREEGGDSPDVETALAEVYQAKGMTQQAEEARKKAAELESGERD
jgi:Flp pilus assembly protein TadD